MQSAFCLFVSLFSLFICWAFDNSCSFRQRILQEDQTRDCGIHHEARFSPWALHSVTLRNERSGGQRKKIIYTYISWRRTVRPSAWLREGVPDQPFVSPIFSQEEPQWYSGICMNIRNSMLRDVSANISHWLRSARASSRSGLDFQTGSVCKKIYILYIYIYN